MIFNILYIVLMAILFDELYVKYCLSSVYGGIET